MFESKPKKHPSSRQATSKSKSKSKPKKKQIIEFIKTDTTGLKTYKSKSLSRQKLGHKPSIDISKAISKNLSYKAPSRTHRQKEKIQERFDHPKHKKGIFYNNIVTEKAVELKWNKKHSHCKKKQSASAEKHKKIWNEDIVPMNSELVMAKYSHLLTKYELKEIQEYKKIYYTGHNAKKAEKFQLNELNFDNQEKQYNFVVHDHIAYRYEILALIGKGSYGQVFLVFDHKKKEKVALKMIRNRQKFAKQAFIEIQILTKIKEKDSNNCSNIIKIKDFVIFRRHVCLLFEKMSENLYELIIRNNYNGLSLDLIRRFAIQILAALQFLRKNKIIHCDLKPQNILLKEYNRTGIKLIDFGSSCLENQTIYTYIQSRYYRAPEITLGIDYDTKIDIWSTGCILGELYTGVPLFPGQNQLEQMKYFIDTLGPPPENIINLGSRSSVFFLKQQNGTRLKQEVNALNTIEYFSKRLIERIPDQPFREFIELFLKWNPNQRITPKQALKHKWIRDGIPQHLRDDDIFYHQKSSREESGTKSTRVSNTQNPSGISNQMKYSKSKSRQKKPKISSSTMKSPKMHKH